MVQGKVWFGTRENMQWITAPAVDVSAGKQGFSAVANFIGGGAHVRRSKASAKMFSMAWNMKHYDAIQPVLDYADGLYGDGYIYYGNPFSMGRNALPAYWASPSINYYDGPVIADGVRPELINNGSSVNGYPVEGAVYVLTSTSNVPSIYIPVPPGYTAHVGAAGNVDSGSAYVTVTPWLSSVNSVDPVTLTLLGMEDAPTNYTVSGDTYVGLSISMGSASSGRLELSGLTVRVLPNGAVAPSGGFISGQGQSGMSFVNQPAVSEYSAALDRVGVSADLIETEAWSWR